jgi:eukaryotic-like serine/threonine-protein kinase
MKKDLWRRAEELFHNALEHPPEARRAFLDRACGEDAELRRQVEMLLSQDEQAGSFLEKPALASAMVEESLMIGKTLGHYRISGQIGKGGMGEVFQAKDQVLGRDVAIKVLPSEFVRDADRVSRFQREAKVLASLNHPNIAAIYGLEKSGETNFLVLELVEGETLAERTRAGSISVEESLKLAVQIAEALEAAHEKGVIHRDLKPANIKVTADGKVKVLDFGLAKAFASEQAEVNPSNSPALTHSPTLSYMATQQGIILGTAAYMSPEQAKGRTVDKKADIWAFGCVLYEMLTGQASFQGEDVTEILAAVVKGGANLDLLPGNLNPRVHEVITRCLQKDLKKRYHDIADVRYEIEQSLADPEGVLVQSAVTVEPRTKIRTILPWIVAAILVGAIIAAVATWKLMPPEPHGVVRFDHELTEGQQFGGLQLSKLAVSPDGKQIAYCTSNGLYLRSVDESNAKPIAGAEDADRQPFFSPDGKWIGYQGGGKLKKIPVNGGAPDILSDEVQHRGLWWYTDNAILYGHFIGGIMRMSIHGSTTESVIKRKSGSLLDPQLLPDGKSILYTFCAPQGGGCKVLVKSRESGEPKELFSGFSPRFISPGFVLYKLQDNSSLFAIPFDLSKLEITGVPAAVVDNVIQYAVSDSGTLAYIPGTSAEVPVRRTMLWLSRDGREESIPVPPDSYMFPRISPEGKRVAFTLRGNIYVLDLVTNNMTRLTVDQGMDNMISIWTPDGKRIIFTASDESIYLSGGIYWKSADGMGEAEKLASYPGRGLFPWSISRDGKSLLLLETILAPFENDIGMISMDGGRARKALLQGGIGTFQKDPQISPNGKWMAYKSNESSKTGFEIYVRSFPDMKSKLQVSTGGGTSPLWSPDGRELFYYAGDAVMAVPVKTENAFSSGKPEGLFRGTFSNLFGDMIFWDIDPSTGKRFLVVKEDASAARAATTEAPRKIRIVLNWFEELKRKAPVK